jgi:hypothetical protein
MHPAAPPIKGRLRDVVVRHACDAIPVFVVCVFTHARAPTLCAST